MGGVGLYEFETARIASAADLVRGVVSSRRPADSSAGTGSGWSGGGGARPLPKFDDSVRAAGDDVSVS